MESVWKQFFFFLESIQNVDANEVTVGDVIPSSIEDSWKHHFFSAFIDFIVRGKRPYGHFNNIYLEKVNFLEFHPVDHISTTWWQLSVRIQLLENHLVPNIFCPHPTKKSFN